MPLQPLAIVWPAIAATAASSTASTASVKQGGRAGALRISTEDTSTDMTVTALTHKGNPLILGANVPVDLFAQDSLYSPIYGRMVNEADALSITLANAHASNNYDCSAAWEVLRGARQRVVDNHRQRGSFRQSDFLVAGSTIAGITAGSTNAFTVSTSSPYRLGRLIVPRKAGLAVTSITINGQPIVSDPTTGEFPAALFACNNPANPRLSDVYPDLVTSRDTVSVTVKNYSGATLNVAVAIVCE